MDGGNPYGQIALRVGGGNGATLRVTKMSVQDNTTRIAGMAPEVTDPKFQLAEGARRVCMTASDFRLSC